MEWRPSVYLTEAICGFPYTLEANAGVVHEIKAQTLPSTSLQIQCSLMVIIRHCTVRYTDRVLKGKKGKVHEDIWGS